MKEIKNCKTITDVDRGLTLEPTAVAAANGEWVKLLTKVTNADQAVACTIERQRSPSSYGHIGPTCLIPSSRAAIW